MIGRTLEHYRIESKLGEGGMGVVYKAHDSRLNRAVALKVLPPERVADAAAKQRFVQEAKAASALNHPGVVTIHDIRSDAGTDFIVMEFVEGHTLGQLITPKGLQPAVVLRYGIQIADAMARAHAAGIVHRDLKPSNLMVTTDGRVKILDFGLAKLLDPAGARVADTTIGPPRTEEHVVLGTVAYMSPEQAEGRALDSRSDIFSFGIVLYEMITGQRPFDADSRLSLLTRIVNSDPKPPRDIVASLPQDLERVILRCLRKDPGRRYQTMADLKVALEDIETESVAGTAAPTAARAPSRRAWPWAAVAALALVAAFASWQAWAPRPPQEMLRAEAITTTPGQELYPSLSPDGDRVAFTWTGSRQDNTDVYVQQIGAGSPLRLTTDPQSEYNPVWSPDGRWIAFLRGAREQPLERSDREVRLIAPLGGPERKLTDIRVQEITLNPVYLAWCPDSTCLITTDTLGEGKPDALVVVSLDTGEKRPLTHPEPPVLADTNPAPSPDGASLLFLRRTTWSGGELHVLSLGNGLTTAGEPRPIVVMGLTPDNAAWLPEGNEVLFSTSTLTGAAGLWRVAASGGGKAGRLPFVGEDGTMPAVSRAQPGRPARLVYVRSFTDENIWRADFTAGGALQHPPTVAVASTKPDIHPQMSPDGKRVAFTSTRSGAWEIWTSDLDGSNAVQLTSLTAPTGTGVPQWSADGRQIVFASDAEGQFDIFVVSAAGGKPRNITSHPALDHMPNFSRDGRWIYFSSARSGRFEVWKVPASGGAAAQLTTAGGWFSQESVDGTHLYFTVSPNSAESSVLWRMATTGGAATRVMDGILNSALAVTAHAIYFIGGSLADAQLRSFDFASRRTVDIGSSLGKIAKFGGFAVSADGRTVFFSRQDSAVDDLMIVKSFR